METENPQDQTPSEKAPAQTHESQRVRIDKAGRLVVPATMRRALGIVKGKELSIRLVDGGIRLQTLDAGLERIWAIAKRKAKSVPDVVDDFIAERRVDAVGD